MPFVDDHQYAVVLYQGDEVFPDGYPREVVFLPAGYVVMTGLEVNSAKESRQAQADEAIAAKAAAESAAREAARQAAEEANAKALDDFAAMKARLAELEARVVAQSGGAPATEN